MRQSCLKRKLFPAWIPGAAILVFLLAGMVSPAIAADRKSSAPRYHKLKKETGVFHYDENREENYLKGVMWKQYQKVPISPSSYAMEKVTFLREEETVLLLNSETFTTRRDSVKNYYEEGGVGYAQVPEELTEHTLTMYKVRVLTGDSAGKEGWVYEAGLGSRTGKPRERKIAPADEGGSGSSASGGQRLQKGLFVVKFKSGKTLTSKYYKEVNDTVTLMQGGRILKFPKDDILSVKNLSR